MRFIICDAEPEHVRQIAALEQICFSSPWTSGQILGQLKDSSHEFLAAVSPDSGTVLGYVGMMYVLDEGYISNVAVDPQYRRLGVADALVDGMVALCKEHGLSFVTLEVRAGNTPAIMLYEKHGFERVGLRRNYYTHPKEDAVLMTKITESRHSI